MIVLVVTGAPLARHAHLGAALARAAGHPVTVVATAAAGPWLDHDALACLEVPVLDRHRPPGTAKRLPVPDAVVPFVSRSLAGHPAWPRSLTMLREAGARLVDPRTGGPWDEPLESGSGDAVAAAFDWGWAIGAQPLS
ncbi:hypothetical protein SAMN04515669_1496 [Jiangella sp. DSM 45060]|nr:hypothetical protein SAMN04515669_1496 [Jiangella sp. DSM 45060]